MKKLIALALICVLALGMFAACGDSAKPETNPPEVDPAASDAINDELEKEVTEEMLAEQPTENKDNGGKLVIACEATFPPYEYMDGLDVVGVDIDIANEIANEMGLELVVENTSFDAVIPSIQSGKADFAASGISITDERKEQVDFSIEYAVSSQMILTTADSGITSPADLDGKKVGVQLGTVADIVLTDENPEMNLVRNKKYTDLAMELANGRIDAIVLDALPAETIEKQDESFVLLEEELFSDSYAIAVQKGNQELLDQINTVLQRLIDEGKIEEFTNKHLGN